jgi:hypothetical protein
MSWSQMHKSVDTAYPAVKAVIPDVERIEVVRALERWQGAPAMRRSLATVVLHMRLERLEQQERRALTEPTAEELEADERLDAEVEEP